MRIVFAGTSEFAVASLLGLLRAGYDIAAVYTKPDRPSGRGRKITYSPVKDCAIAHQLPILQPTSFHNELFTLQNLNPDAIVVVSYGVILPSEILSVPKRGCINLHASLLPRWRGAAPIHRAIESGDANTGVTLMQMDSKLDTGNIFFQSSITIDEDETSGSLHNKLSKMGAEILVARLPEILSGVARSTKQKEENVTYARKIVNSERWLQWTRPAIELAQRVRAFSPRPLAKSMLGNKVLIIHKAVPNLADYDQPPGTLVEVKKDLIRVQTGSGCLDLLQVQLPGNRRVTTREFLNGFQVTSGELFQTPDYA